MFKKAFLLLVLLQMSICIQAYSTFDDTEDLEGMVVVQAGDVEEVSCIAISDSYDCSSWPVFGLLKFKMTDICFSPTGYVSCGFSCNGLLAMGKDKTPVFFSIEKDRLEKHSITLYDCPSPF